MSKTVPIGRIHQLPDNLVNRIAAGEVIERPASVVKELLENSLDAGATRINLDVEKAGTRLVRITDDGHGIHVDDLLLAMDRHTTSKLQSDTDLLRIATLGFRGEALSSIAAVSRMSVISRWKDAANGWAFMTPATGNTEVSIKPAAHPAGTTVEVRNLFYNTPARRKFLRSERTEFIHIQELIKRIVLSRYDLKLQLQHNNRKVVQYQDDSHNPVRRLQSILGKQFTKRAIVIDERSDEMTLTGWIAPADYSRSQSDQQFFFLNGRIIRDKLVNHAVRLAYQEFIHPGRQPVFVLYLNMDLSAVDINVHPTKHEVRFRDTRTVHDFIYGSLVRHLDPRNRSTCPGLQITDVREVNENFAFTSRGSVGTAINESNGDYTSIDVHSLLQGRFILQEDKDQLILLDVHRARSVIAAHKLNQEWQNQPVKTQPILVPLVYKDDIAGCEILLSGAELLASLAIELVRVSPTSVQIRSLPRLLPYIDVMAFIRDLLPLLAKSGDKPGPAEKVIKQLAEHANDLAPASLSSAEMITLLDEFMLIQTQLPGELRKGILRRLDALSLAEFLQHGR